MKKRIKSFGFVFPIKSGKHAGKFQYCYKDKNGLNQHSKVFRSVETCSKEFAQKFAQYIVNGMNASIKDEAEY